MNTACSLALSVALLLQSISFVSTQGSYRCSFAGCFPTAKGPAPVKKPTSVRQLTPTYPTPPSLPLFPNAAPASIVEPTCVTPIQFGTEMDMSAIRDCKSLKIMAERGKIGSDSDVTGAKCDWLENDGCATGNETKRSSALSRFRNRMDNGRCLVFDTTADDGELRLQGGEDEPEAVVPLCCTPVCSEED
eukprot:GHVS01104912.1.p1 GENE.GHVS01104912.1~~GHVS01104912.1.p1  ORF type:complete len:190 (-),score=18.57 GHVS01104912.1:172-741(-)